MHKKRLLNLSEVGLKSAVEVTLKCIEGFPGVTHTFQSHARRTVEEAFRTCDLIYGASEAMQWGEDFQWPEEVFIRDANLARDSNFNLSEMVATHHRSRSQYRLSQERVVKWVPKSDPDYERISDLVGGMRVLISSEFQSNQKPPPQRKLYLQVSKAVNKILLESWTEGLVFILPRDVALQLQQPLHYSPVHWTTKVGKKCGRNLFDSSDDQHGPCLNSEEARVMLEELYGTIEHPTIKDICELILKFKNGVEEKMINQVILWKADLKGAFTLINFRPDDVKYLACELTHDLVLLYHTGLFGWTGTPYAFQVVTRVIKRLLRTHISEYIEMYVDDMIGVCLEHEFEGVKKKVIEICEGLLGPRSVAEDKWDHGRQLDVLGWHIDLDTQRVSIANRNFLKVVCGFCNPDITYRASVHELERLASWSSRYTTILRHATPLTTVLYSEFKGFRNRNVSKSVSALGRSAIIIWRYLLFMLEFNCMSYSRCISSFSNNAPDYKISFDASLTGVGVGVYRIHDNKLLGVTSYHFTFHLGDDSKYQNSVEFIAVLVGMWMLKKKNIRDVNLLLEGDSITALKWGTTERFKGLLNLGSVIAFIMLGIHLNMWVSDSLHVPGVDNVIFDALSRGSSAIDMGFDAQDVVDMNSDLQFMKLIELCDPQINYDSEHQLIQLWKSIWNVTQQ